MTSPASPASTVVRWSAAVIAAGGWSTLILEFSLDFAKAGGGIAGALGVVWWMAAFMTIITNTMMAAVLTGVALGARRIGPRLWAAVAFYALILFISNLVLFGGNHGQQGWWLVVHYAHHRVLPTLVFVHWLLLAPKRSLGWAEPIVWLIYPYGYLGYVLLRGHFTQWYPYAMIDPTRAGIGGVVRTMATQTIAYLVVGYLALALAKSVERTLGSPR